MSELDRDNLATQTIFRPSRLQRGLIIALCLASTLAALLGYRLVEHERSRTRLAQRARDQAREGAQGLEERVRRLEEEKQAVAAQRDAFSQRLTQKEGELKKLSLQLSEAQKAAARGQQLAKSRGKKGRK